ncbi:MAG TPA: cyclic nucleotide-binding domain-containing protein [Gaiellales bacterium]|nr:cyclic nucleotide-binding domain-containing protein [Gaiellales bacterium]
MRPSPTVVTAAFSRAAKANTTGPPRGMSRQWVDALAAVPLFANVPKRHLRQIARLAEQVTVRAGAPVVYRTHGGREFFVVLEGTAVVRPPSGLGHAIGPGDFFGEMSVIDGKPRSAAVRAETDMVLMMLGRRQFMQVVNEQPTVAIAIMEELAARVRRLEGSA